MQLFIFLFIFLIVSVFVIFGAWGQRKAATALEKVTGAPKFFFELLFTIGVSNVHHQLIEDAAKAPEVRCLVVALFNERYLRSPVPPRSNMQRHKPLHLLPPRPVPVKHFRDNFLFVWQLLPDALQALAPLLLEPLCSLNTCFYRVKIVGRIIR